MEPSRREKLKPFWHVSRRTAVGEERTKNLILHTVSCHTKADIASVENLHLGCERSGRYALSN